jgi:hypothetical protein
MKLLKTMMQKPSGGSLLSLAVPTDERAVGAAVEP